VSVTTADAGSGIIRLPLDGLSLADASTIVVPLARVSA
jgi:hypothetical protein